MVNEDIVYILDRKLKDEVKKRKKDSDDMLEVVYEIILEGYKDKSPIYVTTVDEDT
jgi:hypothetical protein